MITLEREGEVTRSSEIPTVGELRSSNTIEAVRPSR